MLEVATTDEFAAWYEKLTVEQALAVERAVAHLEVKAETVSTPSPAPPGNRVNVREMVVSVPDASVRIWFISDKDRKKTLLLCGDATNDPDACVEYLQKAEDLWHAYLDESRQTHAEFPWSGKFFPS
jgi:hypothetical protein